MNFLQNNISLYIPHVFTNYTKEKITDVFENKLNIGAIKSIDLVAKVGKNDIPYNAAYIHFKNWYDTENANDLQKKISKADPNKPVKLFYDQLWFWIVLENKSKKVIPGERKQRIVLNDFAEVENLSTISDNHNIKINLNEDFASEEEFEVSTIDEMLSENASQCVIDFIQSIENELDSLDDTSINDSLITIDGRYVKELEEDIMSLHSTMLQQSYYLQQPQYNYFAVPPYYYQPMQQYYY
jgi:hypothetical protein